jgi:chromatin remodeling complex protein RSC6
MPRVKPSTKSTVSEISTSNNLENGIQQLSISEPVVPKTPRVKKTKEAKTVIETEKKEEKEEEVLKVPEIVEENIVLDSGIGAIPTEQTIELFSKLQQLSILVSSIKNDYRMLEKKWVRDLKNAQKKGYRVKRNGNANRSPSGFVKPTRISDELADFLGKEKGTEMARTAVTRDINSYIRSNSLQDTSNGRKINADGKLSALLKLKKGDELTYFNLQRYMSPHFYKNVKVDASAPVVETVV